MVLPYNVQGLQGFIPVRAKKPKNGTGIFPPLIEHLLICFLSVAPYWNPIVPLHRDCFPPQRVCSMMARHIAWLACIAVVVSAASAASVGPTSTPSMLKLRSNLSSQRARTAVQPTIEYFTSEVNADTEQLCLRMRGGVGTALENNLSINFKQEGAFAPARGAVHTKFICTIGPKTQNVESLSKLVAAGMNVARMNFSHGDHPYHAQTIANIREALKKSKRMCAIMLDTKGPEIRTGLLKDGQDVELKEGEEFMLYNDWDFVGDEKGVGQSYKDLHKTIEVGGTVLIDDGLISLTVVAIEGENVRCRVNNGGALGGRKGVNLPGVKITLPALTEKDKGDLAFGCEQGVDFVAASFVRKASDVIGIRKHLDEHGGKSIKIISKIENQEGLENFDEILAVTDGVMVARGDMGVEIPGEKVALAQKMIISKCNIAGKPVVTATQMLDSMINNPRPTRAETSDVSNAVFDGTDCVMLSGETAKGKYPIQSIETMVAICREAEKVLDHTQTFAALRAHAKQLGADQINEAIASSAVKTAFDLRASLVLCLTETGRTARLVSKYRPRMPVLCATCDDQVARQCLVLRGCYPMVVGSMVGSASLIARCLATAKVNGLCKTGDVCVVISGIQEGLSGGTNVLRVLQIE